MAIARRFCTKCNEHVPAIGDGPNHVLHLLITLLLCGLWLPVWILIMLSGTKYNCQKCGATAYSGGSLGAVLSKSIRFVAFVSICLFAFIAFQAATRWSDKSSQNYTPIIEPTPVQNTDPITGVTSTPSTISEPITPITSEPVDARLPQPKTEQEIIAEGERELERMGQEEAKRAAATVAKDAEIKEKYEQDAATKLRLAKQLLSDTKLKTPAKRRLQEVVDDYPETKAAAEAMELLKGLP